MSPKISIVMAAYNVEKYLSEQIDPILGQSFKEWQLLIRDDGSRDTSLDIIKEYVQQYLDNIRLITGRDGNIGVSQNFLRLLGYADDDVWLPDKIEITFNKMRKIEGEFGADVPLLIHTDLKVVDRNLDMISESFWILKRAMV